MTTPISFKLANLLKEKGFDVECCEFYYMENNPDKLKYSFNKSKKWDFNFKNEYLKPCKSISAPTIAEVVMWLYEKYGIWISIYEYKEYTADFNDPYMFRSSCTKSQEFSSPTEAYEAAIKYTLENLV